MLTARGGVSATTGNPWVGRKQARALRVKPGSTTRFESSFFLYKQVAQTRSLGLRLFRGLTPKAADLGNQVCATCSLSQVPATWPCSDHRLARLWDLDLRQAEGTPSFLLDLAARPCPRDITSATSGAVPISSAEAGSGTAVSTLCDKVQMIQAVKASHPRHAGITPIRRLAYIPTNYVGTYAPAADHQRRGRRCGYFNCVIPQVEPSWLPTVWPDDRMAPLPSYTTSQRNRR